MEKSPRNNIDYGFNRIEQGPRDEWANIKNALMRGCDTAIDGAEMRTFCMNHNYGAQTPIPHEYIGNVQNGIVAISNEVHQFIDLLHQATARNQLEYPFVLTGFRHKNIEGIAIVLNEALYVDQLSLGSSEASRQAFTRLLKEKSEKIQKDVNKNNTDDKIPIVCIGHTHPAITRYYGTTDFGDLEQLLNINSDDGEGNERSFGKYIRQRTGCDGIHFIQCTIMQNGDVDFMNYDKRKQEFRKFPTVANYDKKTNIKSYTFNTPH